MLNVDKEIAESQLSQFAVSLNHFDIPQSIKHEAKRSILNIIGTAFSGCLEPAVEKALEVMSPYSGVATSSLMGRKERCDASLAAFINAMASNIFDYDTYDIDAVDMTVDLEGQSPIHVRIDAARGGAKNPLSNEDIERKVRGLDKRAAFNRDIDRLIEAVWMLDSLEDAGIVARLAAARAS